MAKGKIQWARVVGVSMGLIISAIITPYILLIIGLIIMVIGGFSMSPTINLFRFRQHYFFSSADIDVSALEENNDKIMNIPWRDCLVLFAIGFGVFFLGLALLSMGWRGAIFII